MKNVIQPVGGNVIWPERLTRQPSQELQVKSFKTRVWTFATCSKYSAFHLNLHVLYASYGRCHVSITTQQNY